jgi:allantoate deiminase
MTLAHPIKLKADPRRIARFLRQVGEIGIDARGGWSRLAFSREERAAHEIFSAWASELGLTLRVDPIGNSTARLPGDAGRSMFFCGSHLDTVPRGGNFDGAAGVAASLEVARLLSDYPLKRSFSAVVFSAEEGARFGAPCIGSRVATGQFTSDTLVRLFDYEGRSAATCAAEIGLHPEQASLALWPPNSVAAFLELHIEQGRVLETRKRPIGIVDAIAGSTRLELKFSGHSDHSGATPMTLRKDALIGASEFVIEVERQARLHRTSVATVGRLEVDPGSLTTVPGQARLYLDVRDVDSERQRELAENLLDAAMRIANRRGLEFSAALISDQSPVILHQAVRERLAKAAEERNLGFCILPSGAGHDAAHLAAIAPTGMIFVPSRNGISHAPQEWSSAESIARGAETMAAALLKLDADMVVNKAGAGSQ